MQAWTMFLTFFKIGSTSFGGGPPAIPSMHKELVVPERLSEAEFADGLALSNSMPGPVITNMAVYSGLKLGGWSTALSAMVGAILPTVLIMMIATSLFLSHVDTPEVKAALKGIRPTVIALLLFTAYKLQPSGLVTLDQWLIAAVAFALVAFANLHPALCIVLSGLVGILVYK
jgi:chromate transporter